VVDEPPQAPARGLSTAAETDPPRAGAREILGRALTGPEAESFGKYLKLLQKWQRSQRLVGSDDPGWITEHIFLDSLLFVRLLPAGARRILDVGSGAGVPGIPLKIVLPEAGMTLLEARAKRASFLSAVVRELGLRDCEVVNARLETIGDGRAGHYDALVMRCAGDPAGIYEEGRALLRPGGVMIASGPPRARATRVGTWREVEGPRGPRLFWVYRS
jgi:16S rRNA (guanine527-N7)-methyltransferase